MLNHKLLIFSKDLAYYRNSLKYLKLLYIHGIQSKSVSDSNEFLKICSLIVLLLYYEGQIINYIQSGVNGFVKFNLLNEQ